MDGQHWQCQPAHCEVPCTQTTLGTVFSGPELLWTWPYGQTLCWIITTKSDSLYIFQPFIHQPVLPQETCFCLSGLCSFISGTGLGTPPGGTTPGVKSARISHKKIPILETKMGYISACVLCGGGSAVAGVGGWRFSIIPHDPQLLNRPCLFLKWMLFFSFGLCSIEAILQHGLVPIFCLWTIISPQCVRTSVWGKHNTTTVGQQSDW